MKKILIIEDNREIAELERDFLEVNDFAVEIVGDGEKGLARALSEEFDLILLDVMLPKKDGFTVCRELRAKKEVPLLMVSAKLDDIDKIRGLGLGADDYIVKPFSPPELVARVKSHIARYERITEAQKAKADVLQFGDLMIEPASHRIFVDGEEKMLTHQEFSLLLFLAQNTGIVFSREQLFDRVWGLNAVGDTNTVLVHINRIRSKIEKYPANPQYIETVWGAGYRFSKK